MMKKIIFIAIGLALSVSLFAQMKRDTSCVNITDYTYELGFFQRANRDAGDPRFMLHDDKSGIDFGVGGAASLVTYYGFGGSTHDVDFLPGTIYAPTDISNYFGTKISNTNLYFKARSKWGKHKMIAFVRIGAANDNSLALRQAYISVGGLSAGLVPSFFNDLEVGVMSTGLCCVTQIDVDRALVGYTFRFKDHWELALAAEKPGLNLSDLSESYRIYETGQPVPDVAMHLKYRGKKGHIQLGAVLRTLTYWATEDPKLIDGVNRSLPGWGISLSGNILPNSNFKIAWQAVGGKGIAEYLADFSYTSLSLVADADYSGSDLASMHTTPMLAACLAAEYKWKGYSSSLILAQNNCFERGHKYKIDEYSTTRWTASVIANLFWYPVPEAQVGVEYLYGHREVYPDENLYSTSGNAHRIALALKYFF